MSFEGFTNLSTEIRKEVAEIKFWRWYIKNNFTKGIKILIILSEDLKCLVCGELSLNFTSKASLARHYRFTHFHDTINYILNNILTQDPKKLQERLDE